MKKPYGKRITDMSIDIITNYIRQGDYMGAAKAADNIDIDMQEDQNVLSACASAYEHTYQLIKASQCLCRLAELTEFSNQDALARAFLLLIKIGEISKANDYSEKMAKNNFYCYEYYCGSYLLNASKENSKKIQVDCLEKLMGISFEDEYALILSSLYRDIGQFDKCKRLCKRIQRFFNNEEISNKAQTILDSCNKPLLPAINESVSETVVHPETVKENTSSQKDNKTIIQDQETIENNQAKRGLPDDILKEFNDLVGFNIIKEQIEQFYQMEWLKTQREQRLGIKASDHATHNFILYGNPGTGKTTVARIIGRVLYKLGIREKDNFVEADRSKIVGDHIGATEKRIRKYISDAKGGTLFIDEAYGLYRKDSDNDFGKEAIDTLLKDMEDNRNQYSVILAGYKKPMEEMLKNSNPGFRSRFTYHINIPDYTDAELIMIAEKIARSQNYIISDNAKDAIIKCINRERIDETFGNARFIRELVLKANMEMSKRLYGRKNLSDKDLVMLIAEDFNIPGLSGSLDTIEEIFQQLHSLTEIGRASCRERV